MSDIGNFWFKPEVDHLAVKRSLFHFDLAIPVRLRGQPSFSDNFRFKPEMTPQIGNRTQFIEFVTQKTYFLNFLKRLAEFKKISPTIRRPYI